MPISPPIPMAMPHPATAAYTASTASHTPAANTATARADTITGEPISTQPDARPAHWAVMIAQSDNLYQVDDMLYRSDQLESDDIKLLQTLGIDTIINLRFFDRDDDQENFAAHQGTNVPKLGADGVGEVDSAHYPLVFVNEPLMTWWIKPKQLAQILHRIATEQQRGNKVLVHCYHGADRTGITIAMYRIIRQGWRIEDAKAEMVNGGFGYHAIWKNIERLLTEDKVNAVKAELALLELTVATSTK